MSVLLQFVGWMFIAFCLGMTMFDNIHSILWDHGI